MLVIACVGDLPPAPQAHPAELQPLLRERVLVEVDQKGQPCTPDLFARARSATSPRLLRQGRRRHHEKCKCEVRLDCQKQGWRARKCAKYQQAAADVGAGDSALFQPVVLNLSEAARRAGGGLRVKFRDSGTT